jgi:hypothetical protein
VVTKGDEIREGERYKEEEWGICKRVRKEK